MDGIGTTSYFYDAAGQLLVEDGPWSSDNITNMYVNRLRTTMVLQQPTGCWTNGFMYDITRRLTNVISSAGAFGYTHRGQTDSAGSLVQRIALPNGCNITNNYDNVARLLSTTLKNSSSSLLNSHSYTYNLGNQRTLQTFADSSTHDYTYDPIGQLKVVDSSVNAEDKGYAYDAGWNLNYRTNNTGTDTFSVDGKNQLSAVNSYTDTYDAYGNLTLHDYNNYDDTTAFAYDGENRLKEVDYYYLASLTDKVLFQYDGLGRLRVKQVYDGNLSLVGETHYIYDGWRVIQERDSGNTPAVSYTRGTPLFGGAGGGLEGAGGIGGLLARSHDYSSGNFSTHNFYHADGNGNVTYLVNSSQTLAASYRYDAFGNLLSSSGSLASANKYRFSSKEWVDIDPWTQAIPGLYYYGYRFYAPMLQRWLNRDPLGDRGAAVYVLEDTAYSHLGLPAEFGLAPHLYSFVVNQPTRWVDPYGLKGQLCTRKNCDEKKCKDIKNLPENGWEDKYNKGEDPWEDAPKPGECADSDGVGSPAGRIKIPNNCTCYLDCAGDDVNLVCKCTGFIRRPRPVTPGDGYPPFPFHP